MKNLCFIFVISLFPLLCFSFNPEYKLDRRVLVLLDDYSLKSSHSIFFNSLKSRGFNLEFKPPTIHLSPSNAMPVPLRSLDPLLFFHRKVWWIFGFGGGD